MRTSIVSSSLLCFSPFLLALVAGCSSSISASPVKGPDGDPGWYVVKCKDDPTACNAEAGSVCPAGYDIADDFERQELEADNPGSHGGKFVHCRSTSGNMY